jgi:exodeoxyribonuclease VII large subunit
LEAQRSARSAQAHAELRQLAERLQRQARQILAERRQQFQVAMSQLDALSPLAVLQRGYSLTRTRDGHVVTDAASLTSGATVEIKLARGHLDCIVRSTHLAETGK